LYWRWLLSLAMMIRKKHYRAAKRLRGKEPVLFFPMIMQVDGNISLLRKEIL
jgi:hypothetical protein